MIDRSVWPSAERKTRPLKTSSCGVVPGAASVWPSSEYESSPATSVNSDPHVVDGVPDRGRLEVVRRREASSQIEHELRHLGRAPAADVVVPRLCRIRLVVADRDVVEVASWSCLGGAVERIVRDKAEAFAGRGGLDVGPHAEPERRVEARAGTLLVGAAVVGDQHPVAGRDVAEIAATSGVERQTGPAAPMTGTYGLPFWSNVQFVEATPAW